MPYVSPETQIITALLADYAIRGIAGGNVRGGLLLRNGPMPAVMVSRISTVRTKESGSMTLDRGYTGFCWGRFQIDSWSSDYQQAIDLAIACKLVIVRLDLTSGFGYSKANAILDERDLNDDPNMAGQFNRSIDAKVWFVEEGRDG